jgi:hypothetical protein
MSYKDYSHRFDFIIYNFITNARLIFNSTVYVRHILRVPTKRVNMGAFLFYRFNVMYWFKNVFTRSTMIGIFMANKMQFFFF